MNLPCRFGRYTLVEKVANGGTAEVFRAVLLSDSGFSKTLAVKKLLPSWGENDELRSMLVDEANVLCLLAHQSIVQVHELGSEEGVPFIAMEYVDGIDCGRFLTHIVREGRPMAPQHALYIASQVLTALEFAHRCTDESGRPLGIVHRDVSPSNILISWNGEVKVTDFGIAKGSHRSRFTTTGQIRGKYAYMAPEQARGERIDARADLFACGIVLYELLLARRFFEAETDVELLQKVAGARIELAGIERLPAELRAIIMLALSADPTTRYQSAAEMLTDVRRAGRALGDLSSSLELAEFLRAEFPGEAARKSPAAAAQPGDCANTRVMGPCFLLAEPASEARDASSIRFRWRAACVGLMIAVMSAIPHANGSAARRQDAATAPMPVESSTRSRLSAATVTPPVVRGAVAIDSTPVGARGVLSLGSERRDIVTPFTLEGIDIGKGIDGRVELAAAGFAPVSENFRLTPESGAFVKGFALKKIGSATISVSARPWGLVSIEGSVQGRETPLFAIKVNPGAHVIKVVHPPTDRAVQARVSLAEGESKQCLATFAENPSISCR
ncbi:MAG: serine/threonine-protein kinase [bacterium]